MNNFSRLKVRFAPSPTGYLHIGGARTCLFNWLYARCRGGEFILRIEDTDKERSRKEYLDEIIESIKWLGMNWDQIYYQSQRFDIYREYANKLVREGKAYQDQGAIFFKYKIEPIEINDLIRGKIIFRELPKDEEVIIKSDNSPTYNFSCTIDDALMNINCVIRGEDHIPNTPKQILMYKALGFKIPDFAHLPLILSPEGGRMSKRYGATSIREYRERGYLPQALVNYLLLLGWSPGGNREIISLEEATKIFDIKKVNKTGAIFSLDKLDWLNAEYIRSRTREEFTDLMQEYLRSNNYPLSGISQNYLEKVAGLFQERTSKLSDLTDRVKFCFYDDFEYSQTAKTFLDNDLSKEVNFLIERLKEIENFDKDKIEYEFRKVVKDLGLKVHLLVHPCRIALTGRKDGPGLFETMEVLGKERVIGRLEKLIKYWSDKAKSD